MTNDTTDEPETTVLHELLHLMGFFAATWAVLLVFIAAVQATTPSIVTAGGFQQMVYPTGAIAAASAVAVRLSIHPVSGGNHD